MTRHQPEVQFQGKNTKIDYYAPVSKAAGTHVKNLEKLLHKGLYFKYNFFFDGLVGLDLLYPLGSITLNACGTLKDNADADHYIRKNLAFYKFSNRILLSCRKTARKYKLNMGGSGGGRSLYNMVRLDSMAFTVYNDSFELRNIRIHTEFIHGDTVTYFGLLGQDILGHFNEITMNFNPNSIEYRYKD